MSCGYEHIKWGKNLEPGHALPFRKHCKFFQSLSLFFLSHSLQGNREWQSISELPIYPSSLARDLSSLQLQQPIRGDERIFVSSSPSTNIVAHILGGWYQNSLSVCQAAIEMNVASHPSPRLWGIDDSVISTNFYRPASSRTTNVDSPSWKRTVLYIISRISLALITVWDMSSELLSAESESDELKWNSHPETQQWDRNRAKSGGSFLALRSLLGSLS